MTGMIAARSGGSARSFPDVVGRRLERRHGRRLVLHRGGDRFGAAHHAQHIAAGELGQIRVAPAAADQLGEQQGIAADAVHAGRRALDVDPVEVAAEADMVVARDLDDMLDMVGDQADVGRRRADAPSPIRRASLSACPAGRCRGRRAAPSSATCSAAHWRYGSDKWPRIEIDHHHAAVGGKALAGCRRARCAGDPTSARASLWEKMTGALLTSSASLIVSGETWLRSTSMPSRFISWTTVRPNSLSPCILGIVGRAVGELVVLEVGQRHVARAEVVELAQRGEAAADLVAALDADQRGDLARLVDADDVVGGARQLEVVRIGLDQPLDDVDLLERLADRGVAGDFARDVDRPELRRRRGPAWSRAMSVISGWARACRCRWRARRRSSP